MVSRNLFLRKRYRFTFLVYLCNLLHYLVCLIFYVEILFLGGILVIASPYGMKLRIFIKVEV